MLYPINIVNKRTFRGDGIYIGRGSPLGNPFKMNAEQERDKVCEQYRRWLYNNLKTLAVKKELDRLFNLAHQQELNLVCWCAPKRCHGETIRNYLIWRHNNENQRT